MVYKVAALAAYCLLFSVFISVSLSCPKGYYGSPCQACPPSTYKDFIGDAASCKPCPSNSGHSFLGSVYLQQCECLEGYSGGPRYGKPCTRRSCEPLSAPHNGAFLHVCSSVYGSVCRMGCNEEYEAFGSLERACTVNAQDIMGWTGTPLICRAIRCPIFVVQHADPPTGVCMSGSSPAHGNIVYGTRCTFTCMAGYKLKGCKERVCQLDRTWSGNPPTCELAG